MASTSGAKITTMPAMPKIAPTITRAVLRTPKMSRASPILIHSIEEKMMAASADVICTCAR